MPTFKSKRIDEALLDLVWGQWGELGVPGTVPASSDTFIDLEALVLLTAELAEVDPRLRDEAIGWLSKFERHVSRSRIRHLAQRIEDRGQFDRFLATLSKAARGRWPSVDAEAMPFRAGGSRAALGDLRRPALLQLRMRAIFGVSARAEVLRVLGWQAGDWIGSADLASLAGYTKRNIDEGLDALKAAGIVEVTYSGNRMLSRLAAPLAITEFVGAIPSRFLDWGAVVPVLIDVREAQRRWADSDPRVRDVEASRLLAHFAGRRKFADLPGMPDLGPGAWERLGDWAVDLAEGA